MNRRPPKDEETKRWSVHLEDGTFLGYVSERNE